jgi:nitrous oxidase accessory protein NosD
VTENSGIGGIYVSSDGTIVARNVVDHSDIGIKVGGSGNIICANNLTSNGVGLAADSRIYNYWKGAGTDSGESNIFYANYVANNGVGADINPYLENNVTAILYHNNFISNTYQVATANNFESLYGKYGNDTFDDGSTGNFWSDYNGADADGDGLGDTPYAIDGNRSDRYPLMAPFDVSSVTVELPEWASSPTPSPTLTDMKPLPTALLVAVAIIACVSGFGLIVNLLTSKKKKR